MKFRKLSAIALSAVLLLSLLAGCKQSTSPFVSTSPSDSATPDTSPSASSDIQTIDEDAAYASNAADEVMATVDGTDITWAELFYNIHYFTSTASGTTGAITDWDADYEDGISYADYVLNESIDYILKDMAIVYGARQLGVTLSEDDEAEIQANWDTTVTEQGGEEAFAATLEAEYCTPDILMEMLRTSYLAQSCFDELYGPDGAKLSDDEVADYTAEDGYMMAKHILLKTTNDDETEMTDEEKAAVYAQMEEILADLQSYDGDDFDAYFSQVMQDVSQDPGSLANFPDGYLFLDGEMVTEFEDATRALEIGELSGIVETSFGYHIIYRLPISYDDTPMSVAQYGQYSLRYIVARQMFDAVMEEWRNSLDVQYTDAYNALDFSTMYAVG